MSRSALVTTVLSYNLKVWLSGLAAVVLVPLSLAALAVDLVVPSADPLSERVLSLSAQIEATLDIHGHRTDIRLVERPDA